MGLILVALSKKPKAGEMFFWAGEVAVIGDDSAYFEFERTSYAIVNLLGVVVEYFWWQVGERVVTGEKIRAEKKS